MRPIRLSLCAFGPYAAEHTFDFRELGSRSFFLIHGPTGSGKTTVLDAMCFALYGDTSGNERQARQMRSDMADPSERTEVVFDFSLGTELYRVSRSPEQERPKQRGEGMTTERPKATLWQRTGLVDDNGEGHVLAAKWGDVTEAVESLLGFKSDQFRQVVLLPQGQFRRLLLATSTEREAILERLFQTEFYRIVTERLKEAARDVQEHMKDARSRGESIRSQAGVESKDELAARRAERAAQIEALALRIEELRAREAAALEALSRGRDLAKRFRERGTARDELRILESRRDEMDQVEQRVERARKAGMLLDAETNRDTLLRDTAEADRAAEAAESAHNQAIATLETAKSAFEGEQARDPEREKAERERTRLESLQGKVKELVGAREELEATRKSVVDMATTRDNAKKDLETLLKRIEKGRESVAAAEKASAELGSCEAAARGAETALQHRRKLDAERSLLTKGLQQLQSLQQNIEGIETRLAAARDSLAHLEAAWTSGQATVLAQQLAPGEPCPVCGSPDHPQPANSEEEVPSDEKIRAARRELEELGQQRDTARKQESKVAQDLAACRARVEALEAGLDERATAPLDRLESALAGAQTALEETRRQSGQLETYGRALTDLQSQQQKAEKHLATAETAVDESQAQLERLRGRVEEREAAVPENLREPGALDQAIVKSVKHLQELEQALESARNRKTTAEADLAARLADRDNVRRHATTLRERARAAREEFDRRLKEAGFALPSGEPDAEGFDIAKKDVKHIPQLESDLRSYRAALESARDRLRRSEAAIEGATAPDLPALESTHADARNALQTAVKEQGALGQQLEQVDRWLAELIAIEEDVERLDVEFSVAGRLAEVATGGNAEGISFQRFVLGALLDDVLLAASHRLTLMSKGRYTLQRRLDRSDRRRASGLDLDVFDAYTGLPRPVETLSGGESFLASLSLALGLADVVQAWAGGIHLETIFVDEGFGSLDPESLDLALRALIDLQKGGRLVGIISHMPELKDRVDARLEILPDRRGSRARFVVS